MAFFIDTAAKTSNLSSKTGYCQRILQFLIVKNARMFTPT
jgi:hypothetical protein